MKFRSKNLLVTGGAGFIGSNFINYFLNKYCDTKIINLDLLTYAGTLDNLRYVESNPRHIFVHGDISNEKLVDEIFNKYKIDGVINFAAETHVDNSILNPDVFIKTNIYGVFNLLNIAYKYWMKTPFKRRKGHELSRFHQISTDEIYGSITKGSFDEESSYNPNSPYSSSKASADMLVRSFNKTYGLNTTISICSNNFGPNQNIEKFIPKVINCLLNDKLIPVYGNGKNIRDWIYVKDHCIAIDKIFNKSESGEKYNVGGKFEKTNLELIDIIQNLMSKDYKIEKKIEFVQDRFGHDYRYSLNLNKLENNLSHKIKCNFVKSMKEYILTLKK